MKDWRTHGGQQGQQGCQAQHPDASERPAPGPPDAAQPARAAGGGCSDGLSGNWERDELWELLGRARRTEVSPFFARNVLRKVRQTAPARDSAQGVPLWAAWLARWRVAAIIGGAAALVALVSVAHFREGVGAGRAANGLAGIVATAGEDWAPEDFDVIVSLDELLAAEETSVWTEAGYQ